MSKSSEKSALGVVFLEKTHKYQRKRKEKKTNLTRNKLTVEDKKGIRYDDLVPVYDMWREYYSELVGSRDKLPDDRIVKADYHGALLMVSDADNVSMIGLHGIVALETRHTFQLVTEDNRFVVIPKQGSAFQFVLDGRVFTIFGDAMRYKPCLRGKRQRLRNTLPFFLR